MSTIKLWNKNQTNVCNMQKLFRKQELELPYRLIVPVDYHGAVPLHPQIQTDIEYRIRMDVLATYQEKSLTSQSMTTGSPHLLPSIISPSSCSPCLMRFN
jgi:hypothetical protein